jgi:uncharacterized membrane protein
MAFGPVQLVVIGFGQPEVSNDVVAQLRAASAEGAVRFISASFVAKDDEGALTLVRHTDLSDEERAELRALVWALVGFGAAGKAGAEVAAALGALAEEDDFGLSLVDLDEIADRIPFGSSSLVLVIEHRWAIGLRDAVRAAGGRILADGMIRREMLVELGAELAAEVALADEAVSPGAA